MLSVIIPAMNEEKRIGAVVREARRICRDAEVLVVVNGSTDGTANAAKRAGARVLTYAEALGHDGGRKVGAAEAVVRYCYLLMQISQFPQSTLRLT